ncbi:MAG: hypothetical protein N2035_02460 [Chthoniobacterales bacterium]|nr:hypothetical protein [Chthoniobacterales bacterium]MCX7712520.1 hypothetical protein [Chthoniobacterales bacterium]
MKTVSSLTVLLICFVVGHVLGQEVGNLDPGFEIRRVEAEFVDSPRDDSLRGKMNTQRRTKWLLVEGAFSWQASTAEDKEVGWLEEIEAVFYVMLETKVSREEERTLLKGKVTLLNVGQGKDMKAGMFVSPRALERLFRGRPPSSVLPSISAIGMELVRGGKVVAFYSNYRNMPFWEKIDPTTKVVENLLLPRWKTPFANAAWDYYEEEKISE